MKFSIKDFISKCDQIPSFLRIWSHLLKKSLTFGVVLSLPVQWYYYNVHVTMNLLRIVYG